ncbi:MAG: hypothetical protein KDN22_24350 [Verrucomicrobiae bacterium]|nr:hypothetical protein [Verrucomicrobiae bacterium]
MKLFPPSKQSDCGTVLSNWLVVLVVALALAGLAVATMTSIVAKSRILTAQEQMRGLETGMLNFVKDRDGLPEAFATNPVRRIDSEMTSALTHKHPQLNPEGKRYWDLARISGKPAGFAPTDPFGGIYWIILDTDGDGRVRNPAAPEGEHWLDSRVLVFSAGPDGDPTTWKDNVRNWK